MSGTAVDNILQRLRKHEASNPSDSAARFLVTKLSWRGNYRRILTVTQTSILTQHPESLAVTNSWDFAGDHDLSAVEVGADSNDGGVFILHFRKDKKGIKSRDAKFACKDRAALLDALYRAVAAATARGDSGLGPTLLGTPQVFPAFKLRKGEWRPVQLRVTATALERVNVETGAVKWKWRYSATASPSARTLAPANAPPGHLPFALFSKAGRSPRVYAARDRDGLLRAVQTSALRTLGLTLAVDTSSGGAVSGQDLLSMVAGAERERAATPEEAPLGEWEVLRVRDIHASSSAESGGTATATGNINTASAATTISTTAALHIGTAENAVVPRRLVLTRNGLLERRPATYEVAEWRQLPAVAALIRYAEDPQWLGVEWADGAPRSIYITPARDNLLAALLYAAQAAAGRPIAVLPAPTGSGDPLVSLKGQAVGAPAITADKVDEVERAMLAQVTAAAVEFLAAGGGELSLNSLALAGLTAAATTSAAAAVVGGSHDVAGKAAAQEDKDAAAMRGIAALEQRVRQFNVSVPFSGIHQGARVEEAAITALLSYLPRQAAAGSQATLGVDESRLVIMALHALQILSSAPAVAMQIIGTAGGSGRIFSALLSRHDHVAFEAARLLHKLFSPTSGRPGSPIGDGPVSPTAGGGITSHDAMTAARTAKSVCFISDARCASLVAPLKQRNGRPPPPLLAGAVIEAVVAVVCNPGARTTELSTRGALLHEVSALGRPLFGLFSHPARQVCDAAAMVMQTVAEGGASAAAPMREAALSEGAILRHLLRAMGAAGEGRKLSRDLVALWADAYEPTLSLLRRIFPPGLMRYLDEPKKKPPPAPRLQAPAPWLQARSLAPTTGGPLATADLPAKEPSPLSPPGVATVSREAGGAGGGVPSSTSANTSTPSSAAAVQIPGVPDRFLIGKPRQQPGVQLRGNWEAFWSQVDRDHSHAALIWNERTRAELREALQAEDNMLRLGRQRVVDSGAALPGWNAADFSVTYPSLSSHLAVGGVYVKLLLDGADAEGVTKIAEPKEFFTAAHLNFLRRGDDGNITAGARARAAWAGDPALERELCVRAMSVTYAAHAAEIGPFVEGMRHVVELLDSSPSRPLRHNLLQLLGALVKPQGALPQRVAQGGEAYNNVDTREDEEGNRGVVAEVQRAAAANAAALVRAGGVEILVDLIAAAHEASERPTAALQSNLISSASHAEDVSVWHYLPTAAGTPPAGGGSGALTAFFEHHCTGPVSKAEIRQLLTRGEISSSTLFWAPGMAEPSALQSVRELRWWTAKGQGALSPFVTAESAIRVLSAITTLRPAVDPRGEPVIPLPPAHRALASPRCLPHLAQVALTGEPALVAAASTLLLEIVQHDAEAMATLYRTGIFFFLLAYCGSNLREASRLLHAAHLGQHFRGAAPDSDPTLPLARRSFLGDLLPESLLFSLESYGPDAFAAALTGDSDTPEIIWTHRMRGQRLVPQMLRHVGDLPRRLAQHWGAVYDYTPCPPVGYPEIQEELWCHRYYLRHLCDETRFSNWPLVEHVQLLQALLGAWREELARKPLGLSAIEAAKVLGLDPDAPEGITEEATKAAYRRLARQFHPDRNPAGRDRFEAVQKAYERLQAGGAAAQGGPQPWRLLLLLRAQCILYRRCTTDLEGLKYAGYPLLLAALQVPEGEGAPHFLSEDVAPLLQAAAELCWLTCATSKLNGEELTRSGGVALLGALLTRCLSVAGKDSGPGDPAVLLATQALRAFACMAAFPSARADIEAQEQLVADVLRACELARAPSGVDAALQCAIQMSRSAALQHALLKRGALGYIIPLLLRFDPTSEEAGAEISGGKGGERATPGSPGAPQIFDPAAQDSARGPEFLGLGVHWANMQAARNHHAALAVRALAALAGLPGCYPETPACPEAQAALSALLTPTLAPRLAGTDPRPLLRDLNSSVTSPHVIWNAGLREELLSEAEALRERPGIEVVLAAAEFRYPSLKDELVVAGVYVRVYNEQPAFAVEDSSALCKGLVTQIHTLQQGGRKTEGGKEGEEQGVVRRRHLSQCLSALRNLLETSPRLMGLLATKPALDPLMSCIRPACELGNAGPLWPVYQMPGEGSEDISKTGSSETLPLPEEKWRGMFTNSEAVADALSASSAALTILLKLTAHAGCLAAMADARCALQALWIAHRPPRPSDLLLSLKLLHALSSTDAAAWAAAAQGGVVYLMTVVLPERPQAGEKARAVQDAASLAAVGLLGRLTAHPLHGPRVSLWLGKLLPPGLVAAIQDGPPEAALTALSESSETPERLWTMGMRRAVSEEVAHLATAARTAQQTSSAPSGAPMQGASLDWTPGENYAMQHEGLKDEVFVGGVYVRLFLKSPGHPLRHPQGFLEGLLERYMASTQAASTAPRGDHSATDMAVLLGAAAVAAMQHHPLLAEHGVALGYVSKMVRVLSERVPPLNEVTSQKALEGQQQKQQQMDVSLVPVDDVSGSALRILHALHSGGSGSSAGEALARSVPPAVPVLVRAMQWGGAAAVLAAETLKRGLSPMNRSRDLLVGAALNAGLLNILLERLDWRARPAAGADAAADEASDEAIQRVLFVDVVNLLALDGVYAEQVRAVLDASEVWAAYKGQRHDLFLPAGGSRADGVVGLLRGPEAARFALPATAHWTEEPEEEKEREKGTVVLPPPAVLAPPVVIVETPPPAVEQTTPPAPAAPAPAPIPAATPAPVVLEPPVEVKQPEAKRVEPAQPPPPPQEKISNGSPTSSSIVVDPLSLLQAAAAEDYATKPKVAATPQQKQPPPAAAPEKQTTASEPAKVADKTPPGSAARSPVASPRPAAAPRQETLSPTKVFSDPLSALQSGDSEEP